MSMPLSTRCWRSLRPWRQMAPGRPAPGPSRHGRSRPAQGDHGDLVRGVLRHAMARHRVALRHPVWHALHPVRPVDPDWSVAPAAQPLDPCLAAGLRRHPRSQRRHPRQPVLSFGTNLLRARLRWRQKDQGIDRGIHLAVDKYGFPLAITISPANIHDSKGIVPVLHQLAGRGFKGAALGDLSYRGKRLSKAGKALGITVEPSAGGHGGPSFRREFGGWSSARWHGLVAIVG